MSQRHEVSRVASMLSSEPLDRSRVLDTLINNLQGMAYRCLTDEIGRMIFVSEGARELCGYSPAELVEGQFVNWESITHPEDRQRVRDDIHSARHEGRRFSVQYRIYTRDGELRWVQERGVSVEDEQGRQVIEGFIEDISAQRATLEALEQAELRYRHIFEHASEGIFQTTAEGRYLAANPALARIYGYESPEELVRDLADIGHQLYVDPQRRAQFHRLMKLHGEVQDFEAEVYRRDGSRIWISENAHLVRNAQGEFLCYEGTVQDISERRSYQQQLQRQANHDMLTGLPNRTLLHDRLEQGVLRARRLGYYLALVFIDLDHFKFINDSLGHAAGDELLKVIANRLQECLRSSDTVARLGGDEFVVILTDHYRVSTVITVLRKMLQEIARPVELAGRAFQVGGSLGVALFPNDGEDSQTLLKHADIAMYAAKQRGRNNFQFFTAELNRMADERLHLESALRSALEENRLEVHYQPKVDPSGEIIGVEALARWEDPQLGRIGPDRFIPIAEEAGLISLLTLQVLRQAFEAARDWNRGRTRPLLLAVNLSAKLFANCEIVGQIATLLEETGLAAGLVELEITETVFIEDARRAVELLRAFRELGLTLAMDDFGTGYSSLSYLRLYPLDVIKLDRSLVTDLDREEDVAMIAGAAISLGRNLRKTVVAEGVENSAQLEFLRAQGCDQFQGYLFSRPLPRAEMDALLASGRRLL